MLARTRQLDGLRRDPAHGRDELFCRRSCRSELETVAARIGERELIQEIKFRTCTDMHAHAGWLGMRRTTDS